MICFSPISIDDPTGTRKKINVPCGTCLACLERKREYWSWRIKKESEESEMARFITLTYDDQYLPKKNDLVSLDKNDLIRYLKRLRKVSSKLRYFAVGEYGSQTKRPHYHAIIFNTDDDKIHDKWKNGITHSVPANDATIHYITKYLIGDDKVKLKWLFKEKGIQQPFQIMSKGLGRSYIKKEMIRYHQERKEIFTKEKGGIIVPLPRYMRERIFNAEQLKILNQLARAKAVEKDVNKSYEEIMSERLRMRYLAKKSSKSNEKQILK